MKEAAKETKPEDQAGQEDATLDAATIIKDWKMGVAMQPKVHIHNGQLCGFEAFARPEMNGRKLMAVEFVPLIERARLQCEFDWLVLDAGFAVAGGNKLFKNAPISFNVSPLSICEPLFAEKLAQLAEKHGVDLVSVKIEVLEKMPLTKIEKIQMKIEMVKANKLGFHFSLDDFGTGDSDCSMLDFPAKELKIDAFYIKSMQKPAALKWVKAMIDLARDKGMAVCAEGVEHEWQAQMLRKLGVERGQGYYWAKTLSLTDAVKVLEEAVRNLGSHGPILNESTDPQFAEDLSQRLHLRRYDLSLRSLASEIDSNSKSPISK